MAKKWGIQILILLLATLGVAFWVTPDERVHVVFCDVGQGDAVLVYQGTNQMLIDAGPKNKVQRCLDKYVPFYDRRIELVVLTHPDSDHAGGMADVIQNYSVLHFVSSPVGKESRVYQEMLEVLAQRGLEIEYVYAGDQLRLGEAVMEVIWPEKKWVLGASTVEDTNLFSVGLVVSFGDFQAVMTGDGDEQVMQKQAQMAHSGEDVEVVKVPHHGSRFAAVEEWFEVWKPDLAVISVGKNSYGHPTEALLSLLNLLKIQTLRTDLSGDIEIVSDGRGWWVVK